MNSLFQREMTDTELEMYNKAILYIKERTEYLMNEIDKNIKSYNKFNIFEYKFYLNDSKLSTAEKKKYLKTLKEKLLVMSECDKIKVKVSKAAHPMCWCYHINNWIKIESIKNWCFDRIMYGFSVPFYPSKPIMLAHYVFEAGYTEVKDILAHELTHSLMGTKDLNATNHNDAINDAWTIGLLY